MIDEDIELPCIIKTWHTNEAVLTEKGFYSLVGMRAHVRALFEKQGIRKVIATAYNGDRPFETFQLGCDN